MKKLLLKTILVAAAMCVGMSMWGQTTMFTLTGLTESKRTDITKNASNNIASPDALVNALSSDKYTFQFPATIESLKPGGLVVTNTSGSNSNTCLIISGLHAGDVVTITPGRDQSNSQIKVKDGCTVNGSNANNTTVAQYVRSTDALTIKDMVVTGTSLTFVDYSGYSEIASIKIKRTTATINPSAFALITNNTNGSSVLATTSLPATIQQLKNGSTVQVETSGNQFAIAKYDASSMTDYYVKSATISYSVTAGDYNSGMQIGVVIPNTVDWSASTVAYSDVNKGATVIAKKDAANLIWSTKNSTKTIEYDVTSFIRTYSEADSKLITFYFGTTTARDQTLNTQPVINVVYQEKANVTFSETNGVDATITIGDVDVTAGTSLKPGTYSFTATKDGYISHTGSFTINADEESKIVEFTMSKIGDDVNSITVNYTYGGNIIYTDNTVTTTSKIGDTFTIPFRMYVYDDVNGKLYKTTNNASTYYGESITLLLDNIVEKALTLVNTDGYEVVYFKDLDGDTGDNANIRASYCGAYGNRSFTSEESLPAGIYKFIICNQDKGRTSSVKVGSTTIFAMDGSNKNTWRTSTVDDISIPEGGYLSLVKGGSNTIDYYDVFVCMRKVSSATIGPNGYTTFSSAYSLDLGSMTASEGEVIAYYVTSVQPDKAILGRISENVEAGEGLILRGTPNATITIPVAASGDAITNYLVGCPTATELTPNSSYYVLVNNGENVEFQPLSGKYTNNKVTIPAGKAYLNYAGAGARLGIVFDDETTGVQELKNSRIEGLKTGNYYNLSGQRVAMPTKGLYIVNGKKVVVK